ncbi:acetate--CoA ligase family protein [Candidatus Bipolaricaulota bacterium]
MVERLTEAIVGLSRDPQFGPVVAVGLGGIYTEALGDLALRVAPIDQAEACAMIGELRSAAILRGERRGSRLGIRHPLPRLGRARLESGLPVRTRVRGRRCTRHWAPETHERSNSR